MPGIKKNGVGILLIYLGLALMSPWLANAGAITEDQDYQGAYRALNLLNVTGYINGVKEVMKVYNVKGYGAMGDGVTNDAPIIQNLINSISNEGVIYFPPGTYKVNTTINIHSRIGLKFVGAGSSQSFACPVTRIMAGDYLTTLISLYSSSNIQMQDMVLDGNHTTTDVLSIRGDNALRGVSLNAFTNLVIRNGTNGVRLGDSTINQVDTQYFENITVLNVTNGIFQAGDNTTQIVWNACTFSHSVTGVLYQIKGGGSVDFNSCSWKGGTRDSIAVEILPDASTNLPGTNIVPTKVMINGGSAEYSGTVIWARNPGSLALPAPGSIAGLGYTHLNVSGFQVYKGNNGAAYFRNDGGSPSLPILFNLTASSFFSASTGTAPGITIGANGTVIATGNQFLGAFGGITNNGTGGKIVILDPNGQITTNIPTGTAPFVVSSTTPVENMTATPVTYNAAGTQQTNTHVVIDNVNLSAGVATVTLAGPAAFTNVSSYSVDVAEANTGISMEVYTVEYISGSQFRIHSSVSDSTANLRFIAAGNVVSISGDANNDGRVDVSDLGILAANYGKTSGAVWEQGDFNGDHKVDVSDLGILAANYGSGTGLVLDFNADVQALGLMTVEESSPKVESQASPICSMTALLLVVGMLLNNLILGMSKLTIINY